MEAKTNHIKLCLCEYPVLLWRRHQVNCEHVLQVSQLIHHHIHIILDISFTFAIHLSCHLSKLYSNEVLHRLFTIFCLISAMSNKRPRATFKPQSAETPMCLLKKSDISFKTTTNIYHIKQEGLLRLYPAYFSSTKSILAYLTPNLTPLSTSSKPRCVSEAFPPQTLVVILQPFSSRPSLLQPFLLGLPLQALS